MVPIDRAQIAAEPQLTGGGTPGSRATLLRRFTFVTLGTSLVVGVLFGTILARVVEGFALRQEARAVAERVLETTASGVAVQHFLASPRPAPSQVRSVIQDLLDRTHILHITVWNARGEMVHRAGASPAGTAAIDPPAPRPVDGRLRWKLRRAAPGSVPSPPLLEVDIPVMAAGVAQPVGLYQVVVDLTDLAPALGRLIVSVQLSVVLGVLILYAVLFTIVRRASHDLDRSESALRGAFVGIIRSLVNALDARDMATAHHSSRVAANAVAIARAMGLSPAALEEVQVAAFLHDIGKIGIPDEVLTKEGPLTVRERQIIQRHTVYGYEILDPVAISPTIKMAVRYSHERWDGRGYPQGLAGEAIPIAARIVAVADAFEALTTDRPYRRARPPAEAAAEIARSAGSHFDPKVVEAALRVWNQTIVIDKLG